MGVGVTMAVRQMSDVTTFTLAKASGLLNL